MKRFSLFFLLLFTLFSLSAQTIQRIEPPNWWVGMQDIGLQLMVYGDSIAQMDVRLESKEVLLEQSIRTTNPNYLFLQLRIEPDAKAGNFPIVFSQNGQEKVRALYELQAREPGSAERQGFNNSDVLYLVMPDRFANGDPSNDSTPDMLEKADRSKPGGHHGGDIKGVRDHLDYMQDMGFTAIWLNPVLENNMPNYSYHGYSTTDFYRVDPRYGTNAEYQTLCAEAKSRHIKIIMDMIVNHIGTGHWWMNDMPAPDWLNQWPQYTGTNHARSVHQDPHASAYDAQRMTDGWFVPSMPDLNQRNPLLAKYLIQNAIWWIEYLDLAGIRMDTYPYPDADFMAEWSRRIMEEYPHFNLVGEEWSENPAIVAYWQRGKENPNGYRSYLPALMDFPLQSALSKALNTGEGYQQGWMKLYETVALDFLYPDPDHLVVFPDNHDMSRIFTQLNEDYGAYKLALTYMLTTRGTPQLFYGTEILMRNPGTTDHGVIRSDFPGGWAGDKVNAFKGEGLNKEQKEAQEFVKKLLQWRQTATAVHDGALVHFVPEDEVYVYFRFDSRQKIMVILNKNKKAVKLDTKRFAEQIQGAQTGTDVLSGKQFDLSGSIEAPARSPLILEIK